MSKAFVITNPMIAANKSAEVTLSKFLRVIHPAYKEIAVIGGNITVESDVSDIKTISRKAMRAENKLKRIVDHLLLQLWMTMQVLINIDEETPVYFWIGDKMILPYAACKIKRADVHYFIYGNVAKEGRVGRFTRFSSKLISFMANHAECVCLESPSVIDEWQKTIVNRKQKIIHLYTNVRDFYPYAYRKKTIGMVCRITPGKHVTESIEAFCNFHAKHPEWQLEIIGAGKQEQECRQLISERLADEFINMRGWVSHDEVSEFAKTWSAFLFPTDTEGMPNSVIEMMGAGVPPIASAVGGIKDIVSPAKNGWFLTGTSASEIEVALNQFVTNSTVSSVARCAYQYISEHYTLQAAQEAFMKLNQ